MDQLKERFPPEIAGTHPEVVLLKQLARIGIDDGQAVPEADRYVISGGIIIEDLGIGAVIGTGNDALIRFFVPVDIVDDHSNLIA